MHLRRALLLFAIVLGLAALAASISRAPRESTRKSPPPAGLPRASAPQAAPGRGRLRTVTVRFDARRSARRRTIAVGESASVVVEVPQSGQVLLEGLGLSAPAEPLTPARFDVFADRPGEHDVVFWPVGTGERRRVGVLVVERLAAARPAVDRVHARPAT